MDELCTAFGPPKEMASVLMEGVSKKDIARYRAGRIAMRCILGCIGACVLGFCIMVGIELYKHNRCPITSTGEIIIEDITNNDGEIIIEDEIIVED